MVSATRKADYEAKKEKEDPSHQDDSRVFCGVFFEFSQIDARKEEQERRNFVLSVVIGQWVDIMHILKYICVVTFVIQ
jgi:hypothetical protein